MQKHPKRTQLETSYLETNPSIYKNQAEKALQKAKELENHQRLEGKKFVQVDAKTRVLR